MRSSSRLTLVICCAFLIFNGIVAGQDLPPPVPQGSLVVRPSGDLRVLVTRMAEQVRSLGDEISAEIARNDAGRYLTQDLQELGRSLEDFNAQLPAIGADSFRVRQQFASIDTSWRHLRARFSGPVLALPSVVRAARRVDEADTELINAIGLNPTPPEYFSAGPAPSANSSLETRRLARSLVDRAEAVAAAARTELGRQPMGERLVADATAMARDADRFHDGLERFAGRRDDISREFVEVTRHSARVQADLDSIDEPPSVVYAWRSYRTVEDLLRNQIGLISPIAVVPAPVIVVTPPDVVNLNSSITGWADELVREIDPFIAAVQAGQGRIPEWPALLINTQRLLATAVEFRDHAARGRDLTGLAHEFREVDAAWQRLSRQVYRISRGQQSGPNIDLVKRMGATVEQIHQALGMPGYPTAVEPPTFIIRP